MCSQVVEVSDSNFVSNADKGVGTSSPALGSLIGIFQPSDRAVM